MDGTDTLFTIGHSNHAVESFIATLNQYRINILVDVRSWPYSQWAHQFNREILKHDLEEAGVEYIHMGDVLGGLPADRSFYIPGQERPDYRRMANTSIYQAGIQKLLSLAQNQTIAVMCSEGDHRHCHRHLLITQTLLGRTVRVLHIQPDGRTVGGELAPQQLSLFGREEKP